MVFMQVGVYLLCTYVLYRPSDIMDKEPETGCILEKSVNTL